MPIDSAEKRPYYVLIETHNAPEGKTMGKFSIWVALTAGWLICLPIGLLSDWKQVVAHSVAAGSALLIAALWGV